MSKLKPSTSPPPSQSGLIIIKYPPDYDGELHIEFKTDESCSIGIVNFEFGYAMKPGEKPWDALVRAAQDILTHGIVNFELTQHRRKEAAKRG